MKTLLILQNLCLTCIAYAYGNFFLLIFLEIRIICKLFTNVLWVVSMKSFDSNKEFNFNLAEKQHQLLARTKCNYFLCNISPGERMRFRNFRFVKWIVDILYRKRCKSHNASVEPGVPIGFRKKNRNVWWVLEIISCRVLFVGSIFQLGCFVHRNLICASACR